MSRAAMFAATSAVLFTGCLERLGPDVGPLTSSGTDGATCAGDSNPGLTVSYRTDIVDGVFRRAKCIDCHTGNGLGVDQSGLDLASYTTLRNGGRGSSTAIVIDGAPCRSILVQKIELSPPFGRRMPYNGPPYASATDIVLVRDWIAEGADDN